MDKNNNKQKSIVTPGVYLLRCPYNNITMLKIGFSNNVLKRLKTHISSNPLIEPIGFIMTDDYKTLEKEIHKKCNIYKYSTEWFYDKSQIVEYFKTHNSYKSF
jgi:hypothetical protein